MGVGARVGIGAAVGVGARVGIGAAVGVAVTIRDRGGRRSLRGDRCGCFILLAPGGQDGHNHQPSRYQYSCAGIQFSFFSVLNPRT